MEEAGPSCSLFGCQGLELDYGLQVSKETRFIRRSHIVEILASRAAGVFWVEWLGVIFDAPVAGDHLPHPSRAGTVRASYQNWPVPGGNHTGGIVKPASQSFAPI